MFMVNILFVCTGNVFRSMIAEHCLKDYIKKNKIKYYNVDSCGIAVEKQSSRKEVIARLAEHHIKVKHHYKEIDLKQINWADIIIAMSKNHRKYIKENFGVKTYLFNELAIGKKIGVLDFGEFNPKIKSLKETKMQINIKLYANYMVDYIYSKTLNFVCIDL